MLHSPQANALGTSNTDELLLNRCAYCGKRWPQRVLHCPEDGTALVDESLESVTGSSHLSWDTEINPTSMSGTSLSANRSVPIGTKSAPGPAGQLPARELQAGTRVGDYTIDRKIGQGAMGAVYGAIHPTIGKRVAVKIMNPRLDGDQTASERFTREARSVAAIRHPGIVDVFGFGALDDGRAYLVMEWLEGRTLAAALKVGRFDLVDALDILDQIARGLEAAHDKGIVHRDLKPDNVFLQDVAKERPIVKILDFGLAKYAEDRAELSKTQTGQLLGTPLYMSPEQARSRGVDHRTDIYALGCMAYELICGRVPFNPESVAELLAAHLLEPPPAPSSLQPDLPPELDALLMAMIAKSPDSRPTLLEIREAFTAEIRRSAPNMMQSSRSLSYDRPLTPLPIPRTPMPIPRTPAPRSGPIATNVPGASDARDASMVDVRPSRRGLLVVALGVAAVAAGVILVVVAKGHSGATSQTSAATPPGSGDLPAPAAATEHTAAEPLPAPAAAAPVVAVAAPPKDASPPTVGSGTQGPPKRPVQPDQKRTQAVSHPRKVAPVLPKPAPPPPPKNDAAPPDRGILSIASTPPCNIYVDGKSLGLRTPQTEIKLTPGPHSITLVNADSNITDSFSVDITAAQVTKARRDYTARLGTKKSDESTMTINPFEKKKPKQ